MSKAFDLILAYLALSIAIIAGYVILAEYLLIKIEIIPYEPVAVGLFSLFITWAVYHFLLSKSIQRLFDGEKNSKIRDKLSQQFIFATGLSTMFLWFDVSFTSFKLRSIERLDELIDIKSRTLITLPTFKFDKDIISHKITTSYAGRNNSNIIFKLHILTPISCSNCDKPTKGSKYWLGFNYSETISSSLSKQEIEIECNKFIANANKEFINEDMSLVKQVMLEYNSSIYKEYIAAIKPEVINSKKDELIIFQTYPNLERDEGMLFYICVVVFIYMHAIAIKTFLTEEISTQSDEKVAEASDGQKDKLN